MKTLKIVIVFCPAHGLGALPVFHYL
jgi:hypothetical protein